MDKVKAPKAKRTKLTKLAEAAEIVEKQTALMEIDEPVAASVQEPIVLTAKMSNGELMRPAQFVTQSQREVKILVAGIDDSKYLIKCLKAAKRYAIENDKASNHQKVKIMERRLKDLISSGKVFRKKRVPETGTRIMKTFVYGDNAENRDKNRVGQEYTRVVWEGCDYADVPVKRLLKKKRGADEEEPVESKRREPTAWILALQRARAEMNLGKQFIPAHNPAKFKDGEELSEKQKMGIQLYIKARAFQAQIVKENQIIASTAIPVSSS